MKNRNKALAVVAAAALAMSGLGGTFAYWTATTSTDSQTISNGGLNITAGDTAYYDVSNGTDTVTVTDAGESSVTTEDGNGAAITIADFRMSPGDTVAAVTKVDPTLVGTNLVAKLEVSGGAEGTGNYAKKYYLIGGGLAQAATSADGAFNVFFKDPNTFTGSALDLAGLSGDIVELDGSPMYLVETVTFTGFGEDQARNDAGLSVASFDALTAKLTQVRSAAVN